MPRPKTKPKPKVAPKRRDPTAAEMKELVSIYPDADGLTYEEIVKRILDVRRSGEDDS